MAAVLVMVTVAACSTGGSPASSTATKHVTTSTTAVDAGCRYIVANTGSRSTPVGNDLEYLVSAVAEPTVCYDKITFTFDRGNGPDLPPSYIVEYRKAPFGLEGVSTSTGSFEPAKFVLYVEFRPAATVDLRAGRNIQTYKGNLRLLLNGMRHTNIVEWLQDLAPAPRDPPGIHEAQCGKGATTASTSASTTTTTPKPTTTTKPSKSSTTSTSTVPSTTSTTAFGTPIDVPQQRVVWLIGLDSCRPFTVDASLAPSSANLTTVTVVVMN